MGHALAHFFGLDSASGAPYLLWSGALSDAGELAIVGALIGMLRHHNCSRKGCWRLGHIRHGNGRSIVLCHHHYEAGTVE